MKRSAAKANRIPGFDFEHDVRSSKTIAMKKFAPVLLIFVALNQFTFAGSGGNTKSAVVTSAAPLPNITVPESRTMRIVNFVQEAGGDTSLAIVKVAIGTSGTPDVVVLQASDVGQKMSAQDKNMQINGPAIVSVTNTDATHRAFITYRIVTE
jgi:hypothetical protein